MIKDQVVKDEWLSGQLGKNAYRVAFAPGSDLSAVEALAKENNIFAYAKVAAAAVSDVGRLEELGFHLVDTNIVLEKPVRREAELYSAGQRFATRGDEGQVVEVARNSFSFSRFHLDPQIDSSVANKVKAEWARNFFLGTRGKFMVVAEVDGRVVGFLQLLANSDTLIIDLVGVFSQHRGRGIASEMIRFAEEQCTTEDGAEFKSIIVGTQVANVVSTRLYEKLGFRLSSAQYVFHFHS